MNIKENIENQHFPLKAITLTIVFCLVAAGLVMVFGPEEASGDYDMTNVVGMWKLDENQGTTAYDETDNDNDGTLKNGPTWTSGISGNGLDFDGSDDYVEVPDPTNLVLDSSFTIEFWLKPDSGKHGVMQKLQTETGPGFRIQLDSANIDLCLYDGINPRINVGFAFDYNKWHHVALVVDWENDIAKSFFDGNLKTTKDISGLGSIENSGNFFFGGYSGIGITYLTGLLDEIVIHNNALEPEEFYSLHHFSPIVAIWHMDEGTGQVAEDGSVNDNDGTLINGPTWVEGISGNALEFDGTDDYIEVPDGESFDFGDGDFTIECWIKTTQSHFDRYGYILNKEPWTTGPGFHLYLHPLGEGEFQIYGQDSVGVQVNTVTIINDGKWHHIAGVRNGDTLEMYLDGTLEDTEDCSFISSVNNDIPFEIGQRSKNPGSDGNFDGIIDEVVLHNEALDPEEFYGMQYWSDIAGMWEFNENDGTIAYDESYNGNDGNVNGPTWTGGICSSALEFDGVDDYVEVPHDGSLNVGSDSFTVEFWMKREDIPVNDDASYEDWIVSKVVSDVGFQISLLSQSWCNGKLRFEIYNSPPNYEEVWTVESYDDGLWHHVACVKDGINSISIFVDGVLDNSHTLTQTYGSLDITDNLIIGASSTFTRHYDGTLDEVVIHNVALEPEEFYGLQLIQEPCNPFNNPDPCAITMNIDEGWNLVSIGVELDELGGDYTASKFADEINQQAGEEIIKYVVKWDGLGQGSGLFVEYVVEAGIGFDFPINEGAGYYIYSISPFLMEFYIVGDCPRDKTFDLIECWNLVGYHSMQETDVGVWAQQIESHFGGAPFILAIVKYDKNRDPLPDDYNAWYPGMDDDEFQLKPGEAYWIFSATVKIEAPYP